MVEENISFPLGKVTKSHLLLKTIDICSRETKSNSHIEQCRCDQEQKSCKCNLQWKFYIRPREEYTNESNNVATKTIDYSGTYHIQSGKHI